ncbi:HNH endonuclease, partial [Mycobacterium sp. ITM-2017-0098]
SVHGRLSVTDAALVHQRLAIMIANPCPDDPRTMDQRRADAVGAALGAGSFFLACRCADAGCPAKVDDGRASSFVIHVIAEHGSLDAEPDPDLHGDSRNSEPSPEPEPTQQAEPRPKAALIPAFNAAIVPAPLLAELIIAGARIRLVDALDLNTE